MTALYAGFATQNELDLQYDPTLKVADMNVYVEHFTTSSEAARTKLSHRSHQAYGPTLAEHVTVFPPKRTIEGGAPIFVFIHGGYWVAFDNAPFDLVALGPVEAGFAVVNITYALCPGVTIGEIVRQVRAAIAWSFRNAASFGGNSDQIFVCGHSAGGHLTGMAVATDWSGDYGLPDDLIKGAIPISGLMDLYPLSCSWLQPMVRFTREDTVRESPLHNIKPSSVPVIAAWGSEESSEFARQSRDYIAAWTRAGNEGELLPIPGANHYEVLDGFLTEDGLMTRTLVAMLQRSLARSLAAKQLQHA